MHKTIYRAAGAAALIWSALCLFETFYGTLMPMLDEAGTGALLTLATSLASAAGAPVLLVIWLVPALPLGLLALLFKPRPDPRDVIGMRPIVPIKPAAECTQRRKVDAVSEQQEPATQAAEPEMHIEPEMPLHADTSREPVLHFEIEPESGVRFERDPEPVVRFPAEPVLRLEPRRTGRSKGDAHRRCEPVFATLDDLAIEPGIAIREEGVSR